MPLRNRKTSANTHDKRHENGLAPPSKKVAKPKHDSSAAHNGNGSILTPATARLVLDADEDSSDQSGTDGGADGIVAASTMVASRKTSTDAGSDAHSDGSAHTPQDDQEPVASVSQDAINGHPKRHGSFSSTTSMDISTTIIGPHSLWDVVALLIFLLQLSPTLLTILQLGFAAVISWGDSPFSGFSLSTLTSWQDWKHGRNGNASILAMLIFDFSFYALVRVVGSAVPMSKGFILDAAQVVAAMYLGGGTSVRGGWSHILVCFSIITVPHLLRWNNWCLNRTRCVESMLLKDNLGRLGQVSGLLSGHDTDRSYIRTILEVHILAQGIVRVVRRWFDRQPGTSSTRKVDPEAAASSTTSASAISIDSNSEGARNASTDGRPPGLPPATKEKEKSISSGKKRRKQGNFVRSQQPLWAAIASTKIAVRRETEHIQASGDAIDAATADACAVDVRHGEDRAWIERIDHNEVWFSAMLETGWYGPADPSDVKHIAVRVNGARWSQFEVKEMDRGSNGTGITSVFKGKIYGLSPSENFFLEFIEGAECRVFYSAHLVTRPIANPEAGTSVVPVQPPDPLRPSSPITTLKKSIAAAEHELNDIKARVRKTRKDRRNANNTLKKDVESLEGRLSTFSNGDDRQRQRQTQYMHNIKQAEESIAQITVQLENLGEIPDLERESYESAKRDWEEARLQRTAAREDFESSKVMAEKDLNAKRAAIASDHQKKERLEARLVKLEQTRENLMSSNLKAHREKLHRDHLRTVLANTHQAKERTILDSIQHYETMRQDQETRLIEAQQQLYYLENSFPSTMNGQPGGGGGTNPLTPESSYSGLSNPHRAAAFANLQQYPIIGSTSMQQQQLQHQQLHQHPLQQNRTVIKPLRPTTRGRSSSMLSEISGFTEDEATSPGLGPGPGPMQSLHGGDFGAAIAVAVGQGIARNSSAGSTAAGSVVGSGGGGSQRGGDPKSPAQRFSPVVGGESAAAVGAGNRGVLVYKP